MYLYNLTLQSSTGITQAIVGNFSAPKAQEIVLSKGSILELLQVDLTSGKLVTLITKEIFGQIRKIAPFRLTGNKKDFIVVGSDSGRIVVLEVNLEKREFIKIHQETFGKTGCRRIVPGEYIACDPKGRAIMIGALEKQKFVYIINRDNENKMTISSPLEAHKSHILTYDIQSLDVGYENPMFVCLEVDYGDSDEENSSVNTGVFEKFLVFYEMDLGLNHVVRKNLELVDNTAHLLIPLPGTPDGPGGVLVCCENFLVYKKPGHEDRITPYPRRFEQNDAKGLMIVAFTAHKRKENFFYLLQSELGDIYKLTVNCTGEDVHGVQLQYFDTSAPCNSLCLLLSGYLLTASETSNHYLYAINQEAESEEEPIATYSTMGLDEEVRFNPRKLKNLELMDEIQSLCCVTDMHVDDLLSEGSQQIYTLCGRGSRSSLRMLKPGLSVTEIANSNLPGAIAIWTLKGNVNDEFHKYAVVSFHNSTKVLAIGDKVSEVNNSGFDLKKPSLHVGLLEDNTFIQIFPNGIIHIKADKKKSLYQTSSKILAATSNSRQICVALQDKELMYFELEEEKLIQIEKKVMDSDIISLDIAPIPEGRQRSKFLAVGCSDNYVRILSVDVDQCLSKISMQLLPGSPESVTLTELGNPGEVKQLYLNVGLSNGILIKTCVDSITGALSDIRTRYLGNKSVNIFKVQMQNSQAILASSSKPWVGYNFMNKYYTNILNMGAIDYASSFSSEICQEGIVALSGNTLKIFSIERLGEVFNQSVLNLRYTPRKMFVHPETSYIVTLESEQNSYSKTEKELIKKAIAEKTGDEEYLRLPEDKIGAPVAHEGKWGSCIRMVDPQELKTLDLLELEENEAAFSGVIMSFSTTPGEFYLIVGTAKDMKLHPRSCSAAYIVVFSFKDQGRKLEFLHRTPVEELPMAFAEFQGKLLAGIGNLVRLYEIGKKKLLKKCETKKLTSLISGLNVNGQRIFVNTINESFHVIRYKPNENQLYLFADDSLPRWLTCSAVLDYDTIAGCDKFENFFVYRLPPGCDEESEEDPMGTKYKWDVGYLHGAAYKLELIAQYHRGDLITSLKKCSLNGSAETLLVYGTSSGSIGVFMPFETREEVDFFVHLEMYLRIESQPLCGRDHQMFRSAYGPVKCVIDGDLCEEFSAMEFAKQKIMAGELDKTPVEICKKLEETRNKIL